MDRAAESIRTIDMNADVGESLDGADLALIPLVTSVSIACGVHAGGASTMRRCVDRAVECGVAIGAHPGASDRGGMGRSATSIEPCEAYDLMLYQMGALEAFTHAAGARLSHVKPHGALYTMAARDPELADAIASAICDYDDTLVLYGLAGGELVRAAEAHGIPVASEVFADRRYERNGHLTARDRPDALITDAAVATARVLQMLDGRLPADEAPDIAVTADTICVHGDTPGAAQLASALRRALEGAGVRIGAIGRGSI